MGEPLCDLEALYDEHIAPLSDETKARLAALIRDRLTSAAPKSARLADLVGLGDDVWRDVDADAYVRGLRDEW